MSSGGFRFFEGLLGVYIIYRYRKKLSKKSKKIWSVRIKGVSLQSFSTKAPGDSRKTSIRMMAEEKSSKKIKINFADKKKVLTFATRFGKTEVWNKRRVLIARKFWKFIEKTEEVQASTEKTSKIEKSRSVSSFEELKKSCQESA